MLTLFLVFEPTQTYIMYYALSVFWIYKDAMLILHAMPPLVFEYHITVWLIS